MSKIRLNRYIPPSAERVKRIISEFPDLQYDGVKIECVVCHKHLLCWDTRACRKHIFSAQHRIKKMGVDSKAQFLSDLIYMLVACNLPFHIFNKESFHWFWNKYIPQWKLPGRSQLLTKVPVVRETIENRIISEIQNKKLWLCVGETTDSKKNSVVNVIVRTMEPLTPSCSFLLASKRLQECTSEAIAQVVLNTLEKFRIAQNDLLMFMTDDTATMRVVGQLLKNECGNFLHVTCKLYALHLVAEEIRKRYPNVNELISYTKAVFLKSPKRSQEFHRQCPGIPEPPQPILTRWGTWLQAAFYYCEHFDKIKALVLQFDPKVAHAIKESQAKFQDAFVEADLHTIHHNYKGVLETIEKLEQPSLSLVESLQILDAVNLHLHDISDPRNNSVSAKLDSVLKKDSDFTTLVTLSNECASTHPLGNSKEYFNYANLTSLDVERSFSAYKDIFSSRRTCFTETTVETYLMLQMFLQSHSGYDTNDNDA